MANANPQVLRTFAGRLRSRGYEERLTSHFSVLQMPSRPGHFLVLHMFDAATIDEDVSPMVAEELGPLGLLTSLGDYGDALFAIVASTSPASLLCSDCGRLHLDNPGIWRQFCLNTLAKLRPLLSNGDERMTAQPSHIVQFAAIYRRIMDLATGNSLLDVATNLGLFPILVAERLPSVSVVGCDNRQDAITSAIDLSAATRTSGVRFMICDVLGPDFDEMSPFDTVSAVHVLEHFTEDAVPVAMRNMVRVAARRLIVAVPYENRVQPLYGHLQAFTAEKLDRWGRWCVETLGAGNYWCENVHGGLLVVDLESRP